MHMVNFFIYCRIYKNKNIKNNLFSDMRKALNRDVEKKSIIPLEHPVRLDDCD